ncbi:MAG: allantoinase AllB [Chloroflexi bacterium]|nr:MAG: allantoinase AllB [Chloroflexota bacterium]
MTKYDLIIRGGIQCSAGSLADGDLAISDGCIVASAPDIEGSASEEIDARGLHVFPGVIDAHVHFNEPGRTDWEGFASGTAALAAGGATAFVEMPLNAHPPTVDAAGFDRKLAAAKASSLVDFAFWGGLIPGTIEQMDELSDRGVVGFKAFMSNSGIADFPAVDDLTLYLGMERAARLGKPIAVHAENDPITARLAEQAVAEGRCAVRDYLASRPIVAELEAISRAILFAEETSCSLHVVHVSCGRGVALVAEAQARGVDVTCETCPHYLVLSEEDVERLGAVAKCAPPLRPVEEREALWKELAQGNISFVASDHSPAPLSLKASSSFFAVWGGISGCQTTLRLLLTEGWEKRGVALATVVDATSANVARRLGLPRKGRLVAGAEADLVLVDLSQSDVLHSADLLYRHQYSPFVGRRLRGRIERTLVRGTTVCHKNQIVSHPIGRLLRPIDMKSKGSTTMDAW